MGNVFNAIFGGSKQKSSSTPVELAPAPFAQLRGPVNQVFSGLLSGGEGGIGGIPKFGEPFTAGVGVNEQATLDLLQSLVGGGRQALIDKTISGEFVDPSTNPFLKSFIEAAQRPTLQGLEETLTRSLPGRFTAAGQFIQPQGSSAFDRAAAIATRGAADAVGDIATRIGAGAYEAERGRQQQGIQLGQQEVQTVVNNLQAQALPRLIQQYGIDQGVQEFRTRLNALLQVLATAGQLASQQPVFGNQTVSEGSSTTGIVPAIGSFFGGLGALRGAGGAIAAGG